MPQPFKLWVKLPERLYNHVGERDTSKSPAHCVYQCDIRTENEIWEPQLIGHHPAEAVKISPDEFDMKFEQFYLRGALILCSGRLCWVRL